MKTTFILAGNFNVTPFEIMKQDLDEVILVVNYLVESGNASKQENNTTQPFNITEKDKDKKDFWAAF